MGAHFYNAIKIKWKNVRQLGVLLSKSNNNKKLSVAYQLNRARNIITSLFLCFFSPDNANIDNDSENSLFFFARRQRYIYRA